MIFAIAIAYATFHERPDAPMFAGAALIVASGIYTLLQGRRKFREIR